MTNRWPQRQWVLFGFFVLWLTLAGAQLYYHEVWRDEVRALSLALAPSSLFQLITSPPRDGHPLLWFVLLRVGYDLLQSPLVLPLLNFTFAAAAVAVFLRFAPFKPLLTGLFIFAPVMATDYPVFARNYSISILLMFVFVVLYKDRRRPFLCALTLFLLANTNVHSMLLAGLFAMIWAFDWFTDIRAGRPCESRLTMACAFSIVACGALLCLFAIYPPTDAKQALEHTYYDASRWSLALRALLLPGIFFVRLVVGQFENFTAFSLAAGVLTPLLVVMVYGLKRRTGLLIAALAAIWGMALFFAQLYPGAMRHVGLVLTFLICLYWIAEDRPNEAYLHDAARQLALNRVLVGFFAALALLTAVRAYNEITRPYSMSLALAELVRQTPDLKDAIIMAEPGYLLEPVPYYIPNDTYIPRERKFGRAFLHHSGYVRHLRLDDLHRQAVALRKLHKRPILILLQSRLKPSGEMTVVPVDFGLTFHYARAEVDAFKADARLVASLRGSIGDEEYDVYLIAAEPDGQQFTSK